MDNEVWKQAKDYPNYSVSNTGRVMNVKFGRELAPIISWGRNHTHFLHFEYLKK